MKPSERIKQLCKEICAREGQHQPRAQQLTDVLPNAIVEYLDEEAAKLAEPSVPAPSKPGS